jgi:hypothetical protein
MYKTKKKIFAIIIVSILSTVIISCGSSFEESSVKEVKPDKEAVVDGKSSIENNDDKSKDTSNTVKDSKDSDSLSSNNNSTKPVVDKVNAISVNSSNSKKIETKTKDNVYDPAIAVEDLTRILQGEWLNNKYINMLKSNKGHSRELYTDITNEVFSYMQVNCNGVNGIGIGTFTQGIIIDNLRKISSKDNLFQGELDRKQVFLKVEAPKKVVNQYIYDKVTIYYDEDGNPSNPSIEMSYSKFIPSNANIDLEKYTAMLIFEGNYKDSNGKTYNFNDSAITNFPNGSNFSYSYMNEPLDSVYDSNQNILNVLVVDIPEGKVYYGFKYQDGKFYIYNTKKDDNSPSYLIQKDPAYVLTKI